MEHEEFVDCLYLAALVSEKQFVNRMKLELVEYVKRVPRFVGLSGAG